MHRYPFDLVVRNFSAGSFAEKTKVPEGRALARPSAELRNRREGEARYALNGYEALALDLVKEEDLRKMIQTAFRINEVLTAYFAERRVDLIDLSLSFARNKEELVLTGTSVWTRIVSDGDSAMCARPILKFISVSASAP